MQRVFGGVGAHQQLLSGGAAGVVQLARLACGGPAGRQEGETLSITRRHGLQSGSMPAGLRLGRLPHFPAPQHQRHRLTPPPLARLHIKSALAGGAELPIANRVHKPKLGVQGLAGGGQHHNPAPRDLGVAQAAAGRWVRMGRGFGRHARACGPSGVCACARGQMGTVWPGVGDLHALLHDFCKVDACTCTVCLLCSARAQRQHTLWSGCRLQWPGAPQRRAHLARSPAHAPGLGVSQTECKTQWHAGAVITRWQLECPCVVAVACRPG